MKSGTASIVIILLVLVLVLQVVVLLHPPANGGGTPPEEFKTIAAAFERDALYAPAADYYELYLQNSPGLAPQQKANMLYKIGQICQEHIADYERALTAYTQILELYPKEKIADDARRQRVTCLSALGRDYDAQRSINQLTTPGKDQEPVPESSGPIIATVGETEIRMGDLEDRIMAMQQFMRSQYDKPEQKLELLKTMILEHLLADAARRKGLDQDPEIRKKVRDLQEQILAQVVYRSEIADTVTVGPSDLENFYNAHKDEFKTPRSLKVAHILCETEAEAAAAKKQYEQNGDFSELAKEVSTDEDTKAKGGALGALREGSDYVPGLGQQPEIAKSISELKQGDVSEPIQSDKGWHIFYITEETPEQIHTFEETKTQIENMVKREREHDAVQAYIQRMMKAEKVKIYDQNISAAPAAAPAGNGLPVGNRQ